METEVEGARGQASSAWPSRSCAILGAEAEPTGGWASWTLTVFVRDAWQLHVHPSLVNMSIQAQDVHFVVLGR